MMGPREVPELKIEESPPSMLRNVYDGARGGARAGDLGVPTINIRNVNGGSPGS
jgi:hypothetical protein